MKKKLLAALLTLATVTSLTGCNKQLFDATYKFDYAIIKLPNDEIQSWNDYEGDQLQVKIDGQTYLVHSSDASLISK